MKDEAKRDKKFIAVRGDILQRIIEIANKDGKSVYGFVNEIFEQAIRADGYSITLQEVLDFYALIETMKKAGAIITTSDIFNHLINRLYPIEAEELKEKWYISGVWYGKYLTTRFDDAVDAFTRILKSCMWDISEAQVVVKANDHISLRCIAPSQTKQSTELLGTFIKGVMSGLNYRVLKEEVWKGIIVLELERRTELSDIEFDLESL